MLVATKDSWLDWYQDRCVEKSVVTLAGLLKKNRATKALDFGCGTGRHTVYLAKMGFKVYGFDWSKAAIAEAKGELSSEKLTAVLRVWNMNNLPLPYEDSFFDGILVMKVFHHTLAKKIQNIAFEIERITTKKGLIYIEAPGWSKSEKIQNSNAVEVEPRTLVWSEGEEANVPHHHFLRRELVELFPHCKIKGLEKKKGHYCLTLIRN